MDRSTAVAYSRFVAWVEDSSPRFEARHRGADQECRLHVQPLGPAHQRRRSGPGRVRHPSDLASELGAERVRGAMAHLPAVAQPEQLPASITFLLSDDGTNVSGAIVPSDGRWSAQ